jgi:uncharacterized membrane protein YeaQ/YmgE (transglycosylase-associated protein family)
MYRLIRIFHAKREITGLGMALLCMQAGNTARHATNRPAHNGHDHRPTHELFIAIISRAFNVNQLLSVALQTGTANRAVCLGFNWRDNMNFIIWIVIGGLIGWAASLVMKTDAQQGVVLNVVVGIVGALVGGWLLSPLFGTGTINQNDFSLASLVISLLGAIILLAVVNLLRRGAAR